MHSWIKSNSIVNRLALPGRSLSATYNSHGQPFVGTRHCGDTVLRTNLLWIADLDPGRPNDPLHPVVVVERENSISPTRRVVILMHGNGCDVGGMVEVAQEQASYWDAHVIMPEFPGYGVAPGVASEDSVDATGRCAVLLALNILHVPAERIVIFGHSMGTGPAAAMAAWMSECGTPPAALVLQSAFTSFRDLAVSNLGWIAKATMQRWNNLDILPRVCSPILLLHADKDELIPFRHSEQLFAQKNRYQKSCELHVQEGASHNSWDLLSHQLHPTSEFLDRYVNLQGEVMFALSEVHKIVQPIPEISAGPTGWSLRSMLSRSMAASTAATTGFSKASVASTVRAFDLHSAQRVRQQVAPLSGQLGGRTGPPSPEQRNAIAAALNGTSVKLMTGDNVQLDALWCTPAARSSPPGLVAICFHGNGMVLDDMAPWANVYVRLGFHVLLVTIRGYPGSAGDTSADGEIGMYHDAAAAVRFVVDHGFLADRTVAHGFSLGGSLAAAAALHHNLAVLTLDHTFTRPGDVGQHITKDTWLPGWLVRGVMQGAYPSGIMVDVDGATVVTDGLDTLKKVAQFRGRLFVIYGTHDELMPTSFATAFLEAHCSSGFRSDSGPNHAELPGGHTDCMFFSEHAALMTYKTFLSSWCVDIAQFTTQEESLSVIFAQSARLLSKEEEAGNIHLLSQQAKY